VSSILVEAAVDSLAAALAAVEAGAGRIELCADLDAGGLTPPPALLAELRPRTQVPIFPMIRARAGSFHCTSDELDLMHAQLRELTALGADGFVFGALAADNTIDTTATAGLIKEARDLPVTFHRAFDRTPDLATSLDALKALGAARVLTSGGKDRAADAIPELVQLTEHAAGRIGILPGGSVTEANVLEITRATGVKEVHARCGPDGRRVSGILHALRYL